MSFYLPGRIGTGVVVDDVSRGLGMHVVKCEDMIYDVEYTCTIKIVNAAIIIYREI